MLQQGAECRVCYNRLVNFDIRPSGDSVATDGVPPPRSCQTWLRRSPPTFACRRNSKNALTTRCCADPCRERKAHSPTTEKVLVKVAKRVKRVARPREHDRQDLSHRSYTTCVRPADATIATRTHWCRPGRKVDQSEYVDTSVVG